MVDTVERGEQSLRVILQVDNIQDLIYLYEQDKNRTIKAVYVISTRDVNGQGDWAMNKMLSVWMGIDIRYKQPIYFYTQTGDDSSYIVTGAIAGFEDKHVIHTYE